MLKWAAALALVGLACFGQARRPLVREEIRVGQETWRLEWKSAPVEACGAKDELSFTCPCNGFRFGQAGELDLVRVRARNVVERLALTPFFEDAPDGRAVVQLHDESPSDFEADDREKLAAEVTRRPVVGVMKLGDYNHDGRATEFYLQTSAAACGWQQGIVIGTTAVNPKLHAFGTVKSPNVPLTMRPSAWEALLESKDAVEMRYVACGDHGAEEQVERMITATAKGIVIVDRTYECTEDYKKGKFLREETF